MVWPPHPHGEHEFREVVTRQLTEINERLDSIVTALQDLQAADAALKTEVATFLANVSAALQNAGAASDPAVEQVVADINAEVAALKAADPANAAPAAPAEPAPAPSEPPAPTA